jgi:hypothetical protein
MIPLEVLLLVFVVEVLLVFQLLVHGLLFHHHFQLFVCFLGFVERLQLQEQLLQVVLFWFLI